MNNKINKIKPTNTNNKQTQILTKQLNNPHKISSKNNNKAKSMKIYNNN
jgi:hypothetical protein